MKTEKSSGDLSANADTVSVSESAKRQIAARVLDSKAQLSGARMGPSFFEGFSDGPAGKIGPSFFEGFFDGPN